MTKCPFGGPRGVWGALHTPTCSLHILPVPEGLRDLPSSDSKAELGLGQKTTEALRDFLPVCSQVCIELNVAELFNQTWRKFPEQGTILHTEHPLEAKLTGRQLLSLTFRKPSTPKPRSGSVVPILPFPILFLAPATTTRQHCCELQEMCDHN